MVSGRRRWLGIFLLAATSTIAGCVDDVPTESPQESQSETVANTPSFVGSASCGDCHEAAYERWQNSHHGRAMLPATSASVRAPFSGESFDHFGNRSTFFRRDGKYFVTTDGPDGDQQTYEVNHTFGDWPLQQYLIGLPDGRRQALSIAWDARSPSDGGGRWFHLYPAEAITFRDPLHWTGQYQNWNFMCADCHSTALTKGYSFEENAFNTQWSDINVGCEACHGPGSIHAQNPTIPTTDNWTVDLRSIEICAQCHSRREQLAEGYQAGEPWLDYYRPSLLDQGLYFPDGQIQDEVYVFGSFVQSRMHRAGVVCTDCHEPHSAGLKEKGNALCMGCHGGAQAERFDELVADNYDSPEHHFHNPEGPGGECVNCHMMERTYMVIDDRADHSFRIPRPDLTETFGVPNPCQGCHEDRSSAWAADIIAERFGEKQTTHFAHAIAEGRLARPGAEKTIAELAQDPDESRILRATALSLLSTYRRGWSEEAVLSGLNDADPIVRIGALRGAEGLNARERWRAANHLLDDPLLAVRAESGRVLADAAQLPLSQKDLARLAEGVNAYVKTQRLHEDRPDAHNAIGLVRARRGDQVAAERAYRNALRLDPNHAVSLINLADLFRQTGNDAAGGPLLERATQHWPDLAAGRHARALWLVRQGKSDEAVPEFEAAAELQPENPSYQFAFGIALNSTGASVQSVVVLTEALQRHPENINILFALATIHRDQGNSQKAKEYANRLVELAPGDRRFAQLQRELASTAIN